MARAYAQITVDIWSDDDFRALTGDEQRLYFAILTSPSLSHAGVADYRPKRLAAYASDWTEERVEQAAAGLEEAMYLVVDRDTEEVMIRSFVRHDGLMKQPKMATAMATAHAAIASRGIRGVLVHELKRLHEDHPELNGWHSGKACELLAKVSIDPSTYPCRSGSVKGSGKGNPNPSGKGSGYGSPTPAPTPTPRTTPSDEGVSEGEAAPERSGSAQRRAPARPLSADWKPNDRHEARAKAKGVDLEREADAFRAHAAANDRRQANWDAAFTQWLINARPNPRGHLKAVNERPAFWETSTAIPYDPDAVEAPEDDR